MKIYKDFYGCVATVRKLNDGWHLKIKNAYEKKIYDKVLSSERACKQVMSRFSDGTMKEC